MEISRWAELLHLNKLITKILFLLQYLRIGLQDSILKASQTLPVNLIRKYERPRSSTLILQKLSKNGDASQFLAHWILSNNSAEEWCVKFCLKIWINVEPE